MHMARASTVRHTHMAQQLRHASPRLVSPPDRAPATDDRCISLFVSLSARLCASVCGGGVAGPVSPQSVGISSAPLIATAHDVPLDSPPSRYRSTGQATSSFRQSACSFLRLAHLSRRACSATAHFAERGHSRILVWTITVLRRRRRGGWLAAASTGSSLILSPGSLVGSVPVQRGQRAGEQAVCGAWWWFHSKWVDVSELSTVTCRYALCASRCVSSSVLVQQIAKTASLADNTRQLRGRGRDVGAVYRQGMCPSAKMRRAQLTGCWWAVVCCDWPLRHHTVRHERARSSTSRACLARAGRRVNIPIPGYILPSTSWQEYTSTPLPSLSSPSTPRLHADVSKTIGQDVGGQRQLAGWPRPNPLGGGR